jgi:hypothetical protein
MTHQQIAFQAGYNAALNNTAKAPAMCKVYLALIDGLKVGEGALGLAKVWLSGFDSRINEELKALLESDD